MIKHCFKAAIRSLFKNKTRSIISILGLVAGLFCFTTTNYYARAFYRGDEVFPEFSRMAKVYVEGNFRLSFLGKTKNPTANEKDINQVLIKDFNEIEYIARYTEPIMYDFNWGHEDNPSNLYRGRVMEVNDDFIKVYPSRFIEGKEELFIERNDAALVTRSFINQLGINESVLGKTIILKYKQLNKVEPAVSYTIAGVIEDYPGFTNFTFFRYPDVLVKGDNGKEYTLLLNERANLDAMNARLDDLNISTDSWGMQAERLFIDKVKNQRQVPLQLGIIGFIGFLVLLTGVINFLSFSVGSFINRNRELSFRKILGGKNINLFLLLFVELLLIVATAVLLVIAVSEILYPLLISLLTGNFTAFAVDIPETIWYNIENGMLILILCGLVALIAVARLQLKKTLITMQRGNATGSKHRLRNTLLCIQLFISIFFLIAAGACIAQFNYLDTYEEEMQANEQNRQISLFLSEDYFLYENGRNVWEYIKAAPWTESVGAINFSGVYYTHNGVEKRIALYNISPGIKIDKPEVKKALESGEYFCLINEHLRAQLEKDSIIGYVPGENGRTYPITGTLSGNDYLRGYIPFTDELPTRLEIKIKKDADINLVKEELMDLIQNFIPQNLEYPINTDAEIGDNSMGLYRILFALFGVCATISIIISILGIYGAITLDTQHRQREIAIRKVNGAGLRDIYRLFGKLYISLFIVAGILAFIAGFAVLSFIGSNSSLFKAMFNYQNPVFWILIYVVMALIIFFTIFYRIKQATRINPADIIKTE